MALVTLSGQVLSKQTYFSKKKNVDVFNVDIYDGKSVCTVVGFEPAAYAAIVPNDVLSLYVNAIPYLTKNGAPSILFAL